MDRTMKSISMSKQNYLIDETPPHWQSYLHDSGVGVCGWKGNAKRNKRKQKFTENQEEEVTETELKLQS